MSAEEVFDKMPSFSKSDILRAMKQYNSQVLKEICEEIGSDKARGYWRKSTMEEIIEIIKKRIT